MSEHVSFDYDRFISTQQVALFRGDMLIPMNDATIPIPREMIQRIIDEFGQYDAPHLIYAIEICSKREPTLIAPHLPGLLTHEDSSVVAAAARALRRMPIDESMINKVRQVLPTLSLDYQSGLKHLIPELETILAQRHTCQ